MSLELDITSIKKIFEAGKIFKPATPEDLAKRPKPKVEPFWVDFDTWVIMASDEDHAWEKARAYMHTGVAPNIVEVSRSEETSYTHDALGDFVKYSSPTPPEYHGLGELPVVEAASPFKPATPADLAKRPKEVLKKYRVAVDWAVEVEALDEDEAEAAASELFRTEDLYFKATEIPRVI